MIQLDRRQQLILLVLVGFILFGGGYRFAQIKERAAVQAKPVLETTEQSRVKNISVHVIGAVANPGVYQMPADTRIVDAVNKAAPLGEADLDSLKLAAKVIDGQDIYVPFKTEQNGQAAAGSQPGTAPSNPGRSNSSVTVLSAGTNPAPGSLININTADMAQLDTLPGIGSSLAQRIIQYRETNGPFRDIEDLKDVSGIGDKNFENLKDKITVY